MTSTVINVDLFERSYQMGLVFSLFEGLKEGESFKVVSSIGLDHLKNHFESEPVNNLKFSQFASKGNIAEIEIEKTSRHPQGGCCGVCG